nr:carbohydrate kinase family protein [Candidatus Njordarchaeum guaymaensis]
MPEIIGVGEIVVDMVLKVPHLPEADEKVDSTYQARFPGGVTANYVTAVSRLATTAGFVGAVGDDPEGEYLKQDLKSEKVDTTLTLVKKGKPTPVNYVIVDESGQKVIIQSHHMLTTRLNKEDIKPDYVSKSKLLHTTAIHTDLSTYVAKIAKENNVTVSFDLEKQIAGRGWDTLKEMVKLTDILLPQKSGAMELTKTASPEEAAKTLLRKGPRIVVITLGEKGCLVATEKTSKVIPCFKVCVIDTTGAGDAFNGAFTTSIIKGIDPVTAATFANAAAAIKCTGLGARTCLPTMKEVSKFLEDQGVKNVRLP